MAECKRNFSLYYLLERARARQRLEEKDRELLEEIIKTNYRAHPLATFILPPHHYSTIEEP